MDKKIKILLVEDEPTAQKTLSEILTKQGYAMVSALDGETGLRLARTEKPDLIILDIILPRMEGLDVLAELKKEPETKDIPVIILTNLETPQQIERALSLGATTYLLKTQYTLPEVIVKINSIIGKE